MSEKQLLERLQMQQAQVGCVDVGKCVGFHTSTITASGNEPRVKNCFGFIMINQGDTDVQVNQILLKGFPVGQPDLSGNSFSYVDIYSRTLSFTTFLVSFQPLVTTRFLQIIQVYYA